MRSRLLFFLIIPILGCKTIALQGQKELPFVLAINPNALQENKVRIEKNDPDIIGAYKQLLKDAGKALEFKPVSVTEKVNIPPSGDKHDYMSLAPYHWPDPSKTDGLPYIRKDGQTNPEVKNYKDKEYQPELCRTIHTLSLAWYFTEDNRYAEHARKLIRVWFLDTATKMNPNLNFGQAIMGVNTGRGAGLIDTRHLINVVDAIGLLKSADCWKEEDQLGMKKWFSQFLEWMQTSKNGIDEMNAKNNHGMWYDAQRLSFALFTGQNEVARNIVLNVQNRLEMQMDANGFFPAELQRTISFHYSVFVMEPIFIIAQMATHTGIDLWAYTSPSGKSIKKGFDTLLPFMLKEKEWTGQQIKPFDFEEVIPLLATGRTQFNCIKCNETIIKLAADKAAQLRIHLLTKNN